MTKMELFIKLAEPDENGYSRWVYTSEFVGEYSNLALGNGGSWTRKENSLAKKYNVELDKSLTTGNRIDKIRLAGFNNNNFSQHIRADIKKEIQRRRCVVLGTSNPEVDHKNGMKNEKRVMEYKNQKLDDFQPLREAANDAKRQFCKERWNSKTRFDGKKLGYPVSYYRGFAEHNLEEDACIGCYWYDPLEFKKHLKEKK